MSITVEWLGTIEIADLHNRRKIKNIACVSGHIEAAMLNSKMKAPYPVWVAHHKELNALIIKSTTADDELLYLQTICLTEGAQRRNRTDADLTLEEYYHRRGVADPLFNLAYDGNHRMMH